MNHEGGDYKIMMVSYFSILGFLCLLQGGDTPVRLSRVPRHVPGLYHCGGGGEIRTSENERGTK